MTDLGLFFIACGLWIFGVCIESGLDEIGEGIKELAESLRHEEFEE